jgi:MFS family permease
VLVGSLLHRDLRHVFTELLDGVRLNINETPVFTEEKARQVVSKVPLAELLRLQGCEVVLAAGSVVGYSSFPYMTSTYLAAYANTHLGYSRNLILFVGVLAGLANVALIALSAALCDRAGRRRMMLIGWAACLPVSLVVIPLMDTGIPTCYAVATVSMLAVAGAAFGPIATFIPGLFPTRYRYSGTALAMNLAAVAGGAVPPLIAGTLQATYGSWAMDLMMATVAATSLVCTYLLPETAGTTLLSTQGVDDASVVS